METVRVTLDIETNGVDNPNKLWMICVQDLDTGEVKSYIKDWDRFKEDAKRFTLVVGHNVISYDLYHLDRLIGWNYQGSIRDTLIMSQLLKYELQGGHSLEAWGIRLKYPKGDFNEFDKFSERMLEYCINDVKLNTKLYEYLTTKLKPEIFDKAIECEQEVAKILRKTKESGFPFDMEKMSALRKEIEEQVKVLDEQILTAFPPKYYSLGEYTPKLTKHGTISRVNLRWYDGTDYSVFTEGAPLTRLGLEHFNPGSVKQIVTRLTDNDWWEPNERTKGYLDAQRSRDKAKMAKLSKYGWKLSETNIATLKPEAPQSARLLVERLALGNRLTTFDTWTKAYSPTSASIHGTINGIGTWTHRCNHTNPNLANIAAAKSIKYKEVNLAKKITELGGRMRDLFTCGERNDSHWLVGTDAEGIQLRLFAHYTNDDALIKANVEGKKDLGTDIHTLNKLGLGDVCRTRDDAKTWIYAYLLGAGNAKLASILGCSNNEAKAALERLLGTYQSIKELKNKVIPRDAARGYFQGLDGRLVVCGSEHLMLAGYLQNGEKCIMAHALVEYNKRIKQEGINARLVNWVHDEFQTIVTGTKEEADRVGAVQADCIKWAGENLNCHCPMSGSYSVGKTWLDTH